MIEHSFNQCLQWSLSQSDEPFWNATYRKAFPSMTYSEICTNLHLQKLGIDRTIHLGNGKLLHIDEKKRRDVYTDVLLEYVSNTRSKAPGWIEKDLMIDYIAYAFMPTKRCLLLPWQDLQRVWRTFKVHFLNSPHFRKVSAPNQGYDTLSVAIPIDFLWHAIETLSVIDVSREV